MFAGEHDSTVDDTTPTGSSTTQSAPALSLEREGDRVGEPSPVPASARSTSALVGADQAELHLITLESSAGSDAPGQGQLDSFGLSWYIGLEADSKLMVIGPFTEEVARETQTVLTGKSRLYQAGSKAEAQAAHLEFLGQVVAGQARW